MRGPQLVAFIALFSWMVSCAPQFQYTYMGCFRDFVDVNKRAMNHLQWIDKQMTVEKCVEECGRHGFPVSGLEYSEECYCSKKLPTTPKLEDNKCESKCAGGAGKCGGAAALSVFMNQRRDLTPPDDGRPLLCLVMILKDEGHTIRSTLENIKPWVDCWHILDTGSKDDTMDKIREYMKDKPGRLYEEPFKDYGSTRNRILDLCRQNANPIYTLMLSADETVDNPQDMRNFLLDYRNSNGTLHSAYPVIMNNAGQEFESLRLSRSDYGWRYRGRAHEYLAAPEGYVLALLNPEPAIRVKFQATDNDRRFKSQWFLKRLLEEDLAANPNDTRSMYYLARTNSGIGNHSEAYMYYKMLSAKSKWDEEVYHGMVMAAEESKALGLPWQERQQLLLDAYQFKPEQMDALHLLAQEHHNSERNHLAFMIAKKMVEIKPPESLKVVENVLLRNTRYLYEYEGNRLLGFCAIRVSEWRVCVQAFERVLKFKPDDRIVAERLGVCRENAAKMPTESYEIPTSQLEEASVQNKLKRTQRLGGQQLPQQQQQPIDPQQDDEDANARAAAAAAAGAQQTRFREAAISWVATGGGSHLSNLREKLSHLQYDSSSSYAAFLFGCLAVVGFLIFICYSKMGMKKLNKE